MEERYDSLALVEQLSRASISMTDGWCNTATVVEHDRLNHFLMYRVAREIILFVVVRETELTDRSWCKDGTKYHL